MAAFNPKMSIIIPVFNVENYLCRCLDSAINQTLKEIEILLIYDASKDNSLAICQSYANKYSNVFLYLGSGKGTGAARNLGVENAVGDYICYVDSDDWIDSTLCEDMHRLIENTNADFINFGLEFFSQDGKVIHHKSNFKDEMLIDSTIFTKAMLDDDVLTVVWNKCYRRTFLIENKIKFPEVKEWEDVLYTRKIAYFATKTIFSKNVYYHALIRSDSRSRSISSEFLSKGLELLNLELEFIQLIDINRQYKDLFRAHYLKHLTFFLVKAAFEIDKVEEYKKCFEVINESNYYIYAKSKDALRLLSWRVRAAIYVCDYPKILRFIASFSKILKFKTY